MKIDIKKLAKLEKEYTGGYGLNITLNSLQEMISIVLRHDEQSSMSSTNNFGTSYLISYSTLKDLGILVEDSPTSIKPPTQINS